MFHQLWNLTSTAPELSRSDYFLGLYLVTSRWTLAATRLWLSCYTTWQTQHPSCRDLIHFSWTPLFDLSSLDLTSNELLQLPATVFASMTSLRSHLCGCMQWNVCMLGDKNKNQTQIRSPSSSKHTSQAGSGTLRWRMLSCLRVPMIFSTFCMSHPSVSCQHDWGLTFIIFDVRVYSQRCLNSNDIIASLKQNLILKHKMHWWASDTLVKAFNVSQLKRKLDVNG